MSAKNKGKYYKCKKCKHVEECFNFLVIVKDSCPNKRETKGQENQSTKQRCQECEQWEEESQC